MADAPVLRIRATRVALLPATFLLICVTPLAGASGWLLPLFAVPAVLLGWVLRAGADVDPDGVTVRALVGSRRVPWDQVAGLSVAPRGQISLALTSGDRLRLPATRPVHLPLIAAASGGRLPELTPTAGTPTA
ncbi:MAG: PH domain-containing protein [Actinobacteria bacterium]|nr:PH domain-containing protein [Actinomycetota bacterium]